MRRWRSTDDRAVRTIKADPDADHLGMDSGLVAEFSELREVIFTVRCDGEHALDEHVVDGLGRRRGLAPSRRGARVTVCLSVHPRVDDRHPRPSRIAWSSHVGLRLADRW